MELILKNFKQHKYQTFQIEEHTIFYGSNGTGKTSVLEAMELFFSSTHVIFRDLVNNSNDPEVNKLYSGYISNQTYIHEKVKWKTFSKKRGAFSIRFSFQLNNKKYYVEKNYESSGYVKIVANLDTIESIREFFRYHFIFFRKEFNDGPLSKGEYAIDYMLKSVDHMNQICKIWKRKVWILISIL